jgi:hypothetical protein
MQKKNWKNSSSDCHSAVEGSEDDPFGIQRSRKGIWPDTRNHGKRDNSHLGRIRNETKHTNKQAINQSNKQKPQTQRKQTNKQTKNFNTKGLQ